VQWGCAHRRIVGFGPGCGHQAIPFIDGACASNRACRASSQAAGETPGWRRRFIHRNAEPTPKEPTMTAARTPRFVAFTMSLMMTLIIFSGVASLSAPDHAGQLLARADAVQSAHS
jgi:anti-sigma factor RsiW